MVLIKLVVRTGLDGTSTTCSVQIGMGGLKITVIVRSCSLPYHNNRYSGRQLDDFPIISVLIRNL